MRTKWSQKSSLCWLLGFKQVSISDLLWKTNSFHFPYNVPKWCHKDPNVIHGLNAIELEVSKSWKNEKWNLHNISTKEQVFRKVHIMTEKHNKARLKADRPHPRNYPHTPTNYRHTDKHLTLVMTPNALCCTRQSRTRNIDRCAPENRPWPVTLTRPLTLTTIAVTVMSKHYFWHLTFDLQPWPTIPS